jgi:hypothetical protein
MQTNIEKLGAYSRFAVFNVNPGGELIVYDNNPGLYRVWGLAPSYTNGLIGGTFHGLKMNWWVYRTLAMRIDYSDVLGQDNNSFAVKDLMAVNQCFLLEEAELFKGWIDKVFPEEKTRIEKIEKPIKNIEMYPLDWNEEEKRGSYWSAHTDWNYDLKICYYIDVKGKNPSPCTGDKNGINEQGVSKE